MTPLSSQVYGAVWRAVAKVLRHENAGQWTTLEELHGALLCARLWQILPEQLEEVVRAGRYELRDGVVGLEVRAELCQRRRALRRTLPALLRYSMPGWQMTNYVVKACAATLERPVALERVLEELYQDPGRFEVEEWKGDVWVRARYRYVDGRRDANQESV